MYHVTNAMYEVFTCFGSLLHSIFSEVNTELMESSRINLLLICLMLVIKTCSAYGIFLRRVQSWNVVTDLRISFFRSAGGD